MPKPKFSDQQLRDAHKKGLSTTEIARELGVSQPAVAKRLKKLRLNITKAVVGPKAAEKIVKKELNAIEQIKKINDKANEILDKLTQKSGDEEENNYEREKVAQKYMQEIRGQLKLQLEMMESLHDMKAVHEFQKEVLDTIGEVAPDVRDRIIQNLIKKRAIRSAVGWTGK